MGQGTMALQVTCLLVGLLVLSRLESVDMKERRYFLALSKHYTQVRRLLWIQQIGMN